MLLLEELHKLGEPIALRYKESEARGPAAASLKCTCENYLAQLVDEKYAHIEDAEKEKVQKEASTALEWLAEKMSQQEAMAKTEPPAFLSADITKKGEMIQRFCRPIMSKPKPKPRTHP